MSTTSSTPMPATGSLQLVEAFVERLDGAPVGERRRWSEVQGAGCHSGAGAWHQCFRAGPPSGDFPAAAVRLAQGFPEQAEGGCSPRRPGAAGGNRCGRCPHPRRARSWRGRVAPSHQRGALGMIPSGVRVFLASHPVDSAKDRTACCPWCAMLAATRSAARFMCSGRSGGPGENRLVGWQRRLPLCETPREIHVLLAADRACPGAAQPCPAHGVARRSGLEAGSSRGSQSPCIRWITRLRQSESSAP